MKQKHSSILWKNYFTFLFFIAFTLVLLWGFQIIILSRFYKYIKIRDIKKATNIIASNINEDLSFIDTYSNDLDYCIYITNDEYFPIYTSPNPRYCEINVKEIPIYAMKADQNDGEYMFRFKENPKVRPTDSNKEYLFENELEKVIYVKRGTYKEKNMYIIIGTLISPIDSTVDTLKVQLISISAILILFGLITSYFIAKKISKPIMKINESAKLLATGNYDVTFSTSGYKEIQELGETLNYASKELGKVEQLRSELLANVSHDLRTPLTMITGYGELMRDIPGELNQENINIIINEAKRLTTIVNDVLDINKLSSKTMKLEIENFNLNEFLNETINHYQVLIKTQGYIINYLEGPNVFVNADKSKISQVVYNLINNAVTYSGADKTVNITSEVINGYVKISITDHGAGISEENLELIWERYYKLDKNKTRPYAGSGLGLSIVKGIIELHNKDANEKCYGVESTLGSGSTFWFKLKISD